MAGTASSKNKVVNIGTSLILVVFIILAMVTFAALSAVAASSDSKASQNTAARTSATYAASVQAEKQLAAIDQILKAAYSADPAAYPENTRTALEALEGLTVTEENGLLLCSYTVSVSETQALFVTLTLQAPAGPDEALYTRKTWQERPSQKWEADTSVTLIQ